MTITLHHGNCLDILPTLPDCSIDSIVTDPPYELGFMGKKWDASGIAYNITLWQECLRVLKPGGHLLAFGGTRTYHRMACAIEDAGFEIRDSIHWLYGSGFPKSLDVSKAIDKQAGAERPDRKVTESSKSQSQENPTRHVESAGTPVTAAAAAAAGWGTALKPAHEPVVVARKPLVGTVAQNVLEYGTGAINIDASRIGTDPITINTFDNGAKPFGGAVGEPYTSRQVAGRWPANVILSHHEDCQQVGTKDDVFGGGAKATSGFVNGYDHDGFVGQLVSVPVWECVPGCAVAELDQQSDGVSRFFYCAKPSRRERNTGLDHLPESKAESYDGNAGNSGQRLGGDRTPIQTPIHQNHHPTVKPLALMRYLVRLVTPPGGTVLEPFAGSGTTLMACVLENFHAIGIEMTDEYLPIIEGRVAWAEQEANKQQEELDL